MMRRSAMGIGALMTPSVFANDCLIFNGIYSQSIRWKRKPIWLPTAKTKVFRVPQRPVIPMEDLLELQRLHNNYRTLMNSLRRYICEGAIAQKIESRVKTEKEGIETDFENCMAINEEWNKQVAAEREVRLAKEREDKQELILERVVAKAERDKLIQELVDEDIRKAKEDSVTFITAENIDEAIENALENVTVHDAAIDIDGKLYKDYTFSPVQHPKFYKNEIQYTK